MGENLKEDLQRRGGARREGGKGGGRLFLVTRFFVPLPPAKEEETVPHPAVFFFSFFFFSPPKRSIEFQTGNYSHHICKSHLTVQSFLHEEKNFKVGLSEKERGLKKARV